jgi:phosphatidylglycerophosphate synthase
VRRSFSERYRAMRSRWNSEWWSIMLGGPVGNFLNAFIADVSWITPNGITWVSFLCKLAAVPLLLVGSWSADLAVIALFQLHTVLDCMDGSLARYRKRPSAMGAFLDKTTDMIGLLGIMTALGWRAFRDTGDAGALVVAMLIAGATLLRFYVYWVVMHLEREAKVPAPSVGDRRIDYSQMTAGQRASLYVRSMWRIVFFSEADLYFWFSLGLLLGRTREMIYGIGATNAVWLVLILVRRYLAVHQIDVRARQAAAAVAPAAPVGKGGGS